MVCYLAFFEWTKGLFNTSKRINLSLCMNARCYQHLALTNQNEILSGDYAMANASVPYFKSVIKLDHSNQRKNILLAL